MRVKEGENEGKKATDLIKRIGGWPKLQLASPPDAARCMRCPEGSHSFVDMAGGPIASSEEESRYLDGSGMGLGWVWDGWCASTASLPGEPLERGKVLGLCAANPHSASANAKKVGIRTTHATACLDCVVWIGLRPKNRAPQNFSPVAPPSLSPCHPPPPSTHHEIVQMPPKTKTPDSPPPMPPPPPNSPVLR